MVPLSCPQSHISQPWLSLRGPLSSGQEPCPVPSATWLLLLLAAGARGGWGVSVEPAIASQIPALPLTLATDADKPDWAERCRGGSVGAFTGRYQAPHAGFSANPSSPTGLLNTGPWSQREPTVPTSSWDFPSPALKGPSPGFPRESQCLAGSTGSLWAPSSFLTAASPHGTIPPQPQDAQEGLQTALCH